MIGGIIKLALFVVVIMVALNIFAPQQADKLLGTFSESTNIDKDKLKSGLDSATEFTKDTVNEVKENLDK